MVKIRINLKNNKCIIFKFLLFYDVKICFGRIRITETRTQHNIRVKVRFYTFNSGSLTTLY